MAKLFNLARMTTATAGTGNIALGTAVSGYLTFAQAGVANGDVVSYAIKDGANSEIGTAPYTAAGTVLGPRTVTSSTNANAAVNLSGSAEVFITPRKQDLVLAFEPAAITATSGNAFTVGASGTTNPALNVDASAASAATGINIKAAAAGGGAAISALSSGVNETLTIDAKGSGTITFGGTSTGDVITTRRFQPNAGMLISSASAAAPLDATFNGTSTNALIMRSTTTGGSTMLLCVNPNGVVGSVSSSGSATAFNTASDSRLKSAEKPYQEADCGYVVDHTTVVEFAWKADGAYGLGVIAQDAHAVFPYAVTVGDDDLTKPDARPWSVDYSKYVPVLLAELKALRARVATLEGRA